MKSNGSLWFWILPPVLLVAAYAAYHFYFAEKIAGAGKDLPDEPPPAVTRPDDTPPENTPQSPAGAQPPFAPPAETVDTPVPETPVAPANAVNRITDLRQAEAMLPKLATSLTANATALLWAANDHMLRRFVSAVDCVANGVSPRLHLGFFAPEGAFRAERAAGGALTVDPASYARYNVVADVFDSLDPKGCRAAFVQLEPVLDELYHDLGYADGSFRTVLAKAVDVLLATPVPPGNTRLRTQGSIYTWADPALEKLNEPQKHLLRMGPENIRRIQKKLRQLAATLDLPLQN